MMRSRRDEAARLAALGVMTCAALWIGWTVSCGSPAQHRTMQIMGDSYKHRRGDPLPETSALFDGEQVTLRAVRGETLGVQVLFSGKTARTVTLTVRVPGITVQGFSMDWIEVKEPSTAMYGPSRGPGWYPDRLVPVSGPVKTGEGAFFDVMVDNTAAPGTYAGTLALDDEPIPVELVVEPAVIDVYKDPLVWVWYMPSELALAHGLEPESEAALALEREYSTLFRAHGAFSLGVHSPEELALRQDFAAGATYWPVRLDESGDKARFVASVAAWIELFRDRPEIPFAIFMDEPQTQKDRLRVKKWSQWAREAGSGGDRFLFAVTDRQREVYGDSVDVFISWQGIPPSPDAPPAQRWTYNGAPGHAGSMIIDTDGTALRTWGWIAYRYQIPLWYAWAGMYYRDMYNDRGATDVLINPVTFKNKEDLGNGDGLLAYPAALPSLRLKALRRGLQDRLLLHALADCGGAARASAMARRMIPKALGQAKRGAKPRWPINEEYWEQARNDLIDAVLSTCVGTMHAPPSESP